MGHDARQAVAPVRETARQIGAQQSVKNRRDGQQGQKDAHGAPCGLDHHGNRDHAHHQVQRGVLARALNVDVLKKDQQVKRKARSQRRKHPVAPGNVGVTAIKVLERQGQARQSHQHRQEGVAHGVGDGLRDLVQQTPAHEQVKAHQADGHGPFPMAGQAFLTWKHQKTQAQHQSQVNGAVGDFVFKAKTSGVKVPGRQACTQDQHHFGAPASQAAETRFGVKLLDQAVDFLLTGTHGFSITAKGNFQPAFQLI